MENEAKNSSMGKSKLERKKKEKTEKMIKKNNPPQDEQDIANKENIILEKENKLRKEKSSLKGAEEKAAPQKINVEKEKNVKIVKQQHEGAGILEGGSLAQQRRIKRVIVRLKGNRDGTLSSLITQWQKTYGGMTKYIFERKKDNTLWIILKTQYPRSKFMRNLPFTMSLWPTDYLFTPPIKFMEHPLKPLLELECVNLNDDDDYDNNQRSGDIWTRKGLRMVYGAQNSLNSSIIGKYNYAHSKLVEKYYKCLKIHGASPLKLLTTAEITIKTNTKEISELFTEYFRLIKKEEIALQGLNNSGKLKFLGDFMQ